MIGGKMLTYSGGSAPSGSRQGKLPADLERRVWIVPMNTKR